MKWFSQGRHAVPWMMAAVDGVEFRCKAEMSLSAVEKEAEQPPAFNFEVGFSGLAGGRITIAAFPHRPGC